MVPSVIEAGERLLSAEEAAEFIGVKSQTLATWRCSKRYELPYVRVGRVIRYRLRDLLRWLESRTEGAA